MKIVSLLASATEMLYGLGLGDRVVGVSHECDWPPEATSKPRLSRPRIDPAASSRAIDEAVRAATTAGLPLYEIDESRLAELAPDLIVTQAQCEVCAVSLGDVERAVASQPALAGARIVALNPNSLGDVLGDVARLGSAAGAEAAAAAWGAALRERVAQVRRSVAEHECGEPPRVALIEWIEPLMLSGNWLPELVALAGGEHALTRAARPSPYVAWEAIGRYNPHVILVAPCGFDLDRTLQEARSLAELPGWRKLRAVRDGRVYAVDGNAYFNRAGPRLVDTLEILAHLLHPEWFPPPTSVPNPAAAWRRM